MERQQATVIPHFSVPPTLDPPPYENQKSTRQFQTRKEKLRVLGPVFPSLIFPLLGPPAALSPPAPGLLTARPGAGVGARDGPGRTGLGRRRAAANLRGAEPARRRGRVPLGLFRRAAAMGGGDGRRREREPGPRPRGFRRSRVGAGARPPLALPPPPPSPPAALPARGRLGAFSFARRFPAFPRIS